MCQTKYLYASFWSFLSVTFECVELNIYIWAFLTPLTFSLRGTRALVGATGGFSRALPIVQLESISGFDLQLIHSCWKESLTQPAIYGLPKFHWL